MIIVRQSHQKQPILSADTLLSAVGNGEELLYLDYFHHITGPGLSGTFDSSFWTHLLPQIGQFEPAVLHALVALSSLHARSGFSEDPIALDQDFSDRFALQQYNKAIVSLKNRIATGKDSIDVTCIVCAIFIAFECLRCNQDLAMNHLYSGLKILSSTRSKTKESQYVNESLWKIFTRLDGQMTVFGKPIMDISTVEPPEKIARPVVPLAFTNFVEAMASLDRLMNSTLRFVGSILGSKYEKPLGISAQIQQFEIQGLLQQWFSTFEALVKTTKEEYDAKTQREEIILRLLHKGTYIWLSTCLITCEISYDLFIPDFESIVNWAEKLAAIPTPKSFFTLDMSIIPPLFLTAIKCRRSWIRRKAIQQLYATPSREGLWDSKIHAKAAERMIDIEESTLEGPDDLPSEAARIHNSQITINPNGYPARTSVSVSFYTKPYGLDGDWVIWEEQL